MRVWLCVLTASLLVIPPAGWCTTGEPGRAPSDLGVYHTYAEMVSDLQNLTAAHPGIAMLVPLRQTYENRTLWAVKLSDNVSLDEAEPNITILGGIHARELIGVEVALYLLEKLAGGYGSNASIRRLVDGTQMWFVPMVNPDGHVFVEQGNDWRKNRNSTTGGSIGVDINRNFGHLWGLEAPHTPSAEDFCGPAAFSENETQAVRDLVTAHPMKASISYHSFGPYILYPWGNSIDGTAVDPRLPELARNMSLAMPEGRRYTPMMARNMYPATGDTDDYFYANLSMLPFTVELASAYRPPDDQVAQICADNLPAALTVARFIVGPEAPPVRHAMSLEGPQSFSSLPGVSIDLNYTLRNTGDADEMVDLAVTCTTAPWSFGIGQGPFTVRAGGNAWVPLRVVIPANASAFQNARIIYSALAASGANCSIEVTGTVQQVHKLSISLTVPAEVVAGQSETVTVNISNDGNGRESALLSAGTNAGWDIGTVPNPYNLSAGEAGQLNIAVYVPRNAIGGNRTTFSFGAGTRDGYHVTEERTMTVLVFKNMTMAASAPRVKVTKDERTDLVLRLTNGGNGWENGTLRLSGTHPYGSLERTTVSIPPFSTLNVNLSVDGKGKGGNLTVRFTGPTEELRAEQTIGVTVTANTTANGTGQTPPANVILVLVVVTILFVAVMAFVLWDIRRRDEVELQELERHKSLAGMKPTRSGERHHLRRDGAGKRS